MLGSLLEYIVGPDPIKLGSSPGISEIPYVIQLDGFINSNNLPPLTAEIDCLTIFISSIDAPDFKSSLLIFCFSTKFCPSFGF